MRKDILSSIKKIQQASDQHKLVIFVGNGVSRNSEGIPSWWSIIKRFLDDVEIPEEIIKKEDYIKAAQYYYNSKGHKEYYDTIDELFKKTKQAKPNPIHKLIFNLKPEHIITTNFDDLLEKYSKDEGEWDVVKENKDLSYGSSNHKIVKMHGDLDLKNIVLIEDDYLSYSQNFTLIEVFLKSLFATHTVLFLGYSLRDNNLNLILQWVKDLMNEDFQPVYWLDLDSEYNVNQYNYWKKRGINVFYYDDFAEEFKEDRKGTEDDLKILNLSQGQKLYKFIDFIIQYEEEVDPLDKIYQYLLPFDKLKIISPNFFKGRSNNQPFKICQLSESGTYYFSIDKYNIKKILTEYLELEDYHSELEEEEKKLKEKVLLKENEEKTREVIQQIKPYQETVNLVFKIFAKANLVPFNDLDIEFYVEKYQETLKESPYLNLYRNFEFEKLYNSLEDNTENTENTEYDYLEIAYYYHKLRYYTQAVRTLFKAKRKLQDSKNIIIDLIVDFNLDNLQLMIRNKHLQDRIEKLRFRERIASIPNHFKKQFGYLINDIFSYKAITYHISELIEHSDKLKKLNLEEGGWSSHNPLNDSICIITEFDRFLEDNHIICYHYQNVKDMYRYFLEQYFYLYNLRIEEEEGSKYPVEHFKINDIDLMIVYWIIDYLNTTELNNLLNPVKEIKLTPENQRYLISSYNNLFKSVHIKGESKYELENPNPDRINKLFLILSKVKLSEKEHLEILKKRLEVFNFNPSFEDFRHIYRFLYNLYKLDNNVIKGQIYKEVIYFYLNSLENFFYIKRDGFNLYFIDLILSTIALHKYKDFILEENRIKQDFLGIIKLDQAFDLIDGAFIRLMSYFPESLKNRVQKSLLDYINSLSTKHDSFLVEEKERIKDRNFEKYIWLFDVILHLIHCIDLTEKQIEGYLLYLFDILSECYKIKGVNGDKLKRFREIHFDNILNMFLREDIILTDQFQEKLKECTIDSRKLDFILDPESFDYNQLELKWFFYMENSLDKYLKIPGFKEKGKELLANFIMNENPAFKDIDALTLKKIFIEKFSC